MDMLLLLLASKISIRTLLPPFAEQLAHLRHTRVYVLGGCEATYGGETYIETGTFVACNHSLSIMNIRTSIDCATPTAQLEGGHSPFGYRT